MSALTRTIIVGLMALAFLAGLGFEIYVISKSERDIVNALQAADTEIGSDIRVRSILAMQENSRDSFAVIEEAILTKAELVGLVESLERLGREMGLSVSISSITNDQARPAPNTPEAVRIAIESAGGWASSLSFVRMLESLPHKYSVERADLVQNVDGWMTNTIIRLTTYPEK